MHTCCIRVLLKTLSGIYAAVTRWPIQVAAVYAPPAMHFYEAVITHAPAAQLQMSLTCFVLSDAEVFCSYVPSDLTICSYLSVTRDLLLQALALGADAVLLGRPVMFGLALDGQKGVERILDLLRRELELAMVLAGCSSLQDVSKDLLMQYPASML